MLGKLDPPVQSYALTYLKRHWYRLNIDPEFDPDFDGYITQVNKVLSEKSLNAVSKRKSLHQEYLREQNKKIATDLASIFKLLFLIAVIYSKTLSFLIALAVSILTVYSNAKQPLKFSRACLRKISQDQFFHAILYILPLIIYREFIGSIFLVPLLLLFFLRISERLATEKKFQQISKWIPAPETLIIQKTSMEFGLFLLLVFHLIFSGGNIFLVISYLLYLRIKYLICSYSRGIFKFLDVFSTNLANKHGITSFIKYVNSPIKNLLLKMSPIEAKKKNS